MNVEWDIGFRVDHSAAQGKPMNAQSFASPQNIEKTGATPPQSIVNATFCSRIMAENGLCEYFMLESNVDNRRQGRCSKDDEFMQFFRYNLQLCALQEDNFKTWQWQRKQTQGGDDQCRKIQNENNKKYDAHNELTK